MTKEVEILNELRKAERAYKYTKEEVNEAIDQAIKALDQQPCEDCISRDELNEAISALTFWHPTNDGRLEIGGLNDKTVYKLDDVWRLTYTLPSVQPQQRWIPVSERLPEEFDDVLCSTDVEEVFIATYLGKMNDGTDCFDDNEGMMWEGDVVAWMPLPEPYKEESNKESEE